MVGAFGSVDETRDLVGERAPLALHLLESLRAGPGQPVVLARMRRLVLHPRRGEQTVARQPGENRIERSLGDDAIGERVEVLDDREAVAWPGRDRQEDCEVEAAAPELFLPGLVRHALCHK